MRYLPFVLLLGLACAKAPESRTDRTPAADCDAAVHGIENGSLAVAGHAVTYTGSGAITLARTVACRQLALALTGADGAPPVRMEFLRSYGIVRLDLPARLERVDEADTTFADPLATAAYVVHGRAGGYFLDVHVVQPALALARTAAGNITLELAPGGGAVPTAAPRARNVVVLEPRQGSATYPLTIRGYARTFEANVQAWITSGDSTYAKTFTTAADWSTTWGEFEITIPRGPSGDVQLFVGEESAKDGTPIGVTIPLRMP